VTDAAKSRRANPYVFFVGCPRSGTTLIQRLGNAHPLLAVIDEQEWIAKWWEGRVGIGPDGTVTPELVERLLSHKRFPRLGVEPERIAELVRNGGPKHYTAFVTELFDLRGQLEGKPLVGEKSPSYVKHVATMHELFPSARFVHLIRDGRDVALSALAWKKSERSLGRFPTWQNDTVTTAAIWWEWHVRLGREIGASLDPDLYYELRYESLVEDPEDECRKLCEFLVVPYDEKMLRFHEGRTRVRPGLGAKAAWLPVTAGLRSWREQMSPDDVARFEAVCSPLLDELGYTSGAGAVSEEQRDGAMRLRDAFAASVRSRGRRLPDAWTGGEA
jgi:sulfotransferase family protein